MPISYKVIGRHIRDAQRVVLRRAQPPISWVCRRSITARSSAESAQSIWNGWCRSAICGTTVCALLEGFDTDAAPVTQRPAEMDAFLSAMREIAGGCTEQSRALMLRVCAEIAAIDKN